MTNYKILATVVYHLSCRPTTINIRIFSKCLVLDITFFGSVKAKPLEIHYRIMPDRYCYEMHPQSTGNNCKQTASKMENAVEIHCKVQLSRVPEIIKLDLFFIHFTSS
jgi:hypothetical protein